MRGRRSSLAALIAVVAACVLAACQSGGSGDAASEGDDVGEVRSGTEDRVFRGTPVEHSEAMAACYEGMGLAVERDETDPTTFTIDTRGLADDEARQMLEQCVDEVGPYTPASFPDGYVEEIYEHRRWQRDCLIGLGYELAPPPSFDSFAEAMEWDPFGDVVMAAGLQGLEFDDVLRECPYLHQYERQVERGQR